MISKKVLDAFNEQMKEEAGSAYIYLAMAGYFHSQGLDGMAHWMRVQTQEELGHAMKFFEHIRDRMGKIKVLGIDEPKADWKSPLAAFQAAYGHEQYITGKINKLVDLAAKEDDKAAAAFLQWFVTEQVEEEAQTLKIVDTLKRIGESGGALVMLDHELGKRGS